METYAVTAGESLWDVCLNATGTLENDNLDKILDANDFDDWTPILTAGQLIAIPDTVIKDLNALKQLQVYALCNSTVNDVLDQIETIFDILSNNWILEDGTWNGNAVWTAGGIWKTV